MYEHTEEVGVSSDVVPVAEVVDVHERIEGESNYSQVGESSGNPLVAVRDAKQTHDSEVVVSDPHHGGEGVESGEDAEVPVVNGKSDDVADVWPRLLVALQRAVVAQHAQTHQQEQHNQRAGHQRHRRELEGDAAIFHQHNRGLRLH